jgi:arabinose-5-phosphate isomerase
MQDVMTVKCRTIGPHELAAAGAQLMDQHRITVLPVIEDGRLLGAFNVHDLLRAGVM